MISIPLMHFQRLAPSTLRAMRGFVEITSRGKPLATLHMFDTPVRCKSANAPVAKAKKKRGRK